MFGLYERVEWFGRIRRVSDVDSCVKGTRAERRKMETWKTRKGRV
jgi:hypothetical protein